MSEAPIRTSGWWPSCERLFAEVDPVPPLVIETAKASLGWRRLDADLAELLSDSALEEEAFAWPVAARLRRER